MKRIFHNVSARLPGEKKVSSVMRVRRNEVTFREALIAHFFLTEFPTTFSSVVLEQDLLRDETIMKVKFRNGRHVDWSFTKVDEQIDPNFFKNPTLMTMCLMVHALTDESE